MQEGIVITGRANRVSEAAPTTSWWLGLSREAFSAAARERQRIIYRSTPAYQNAEKDSI